MKDIPTTKERTLESREADPLVKEAEIKFSKGLSTILKLFCTMCAKDHSAIAKKMRIAPSTLSMAKQGRALRRLTANRIMIALDLTTNQIIENSPETRQAVIERADKF